MNSAHASHDAPPPSVASWYTPGRSDGFGDRLLMFDNTDAISLELLRFRRDLASSPGFENALRDRVDHLAHFRHPSFPLLRAVVHLDDEDLTLVSAHTAGQRLSELATGRLRKGLHPAVVTWIIREITPALAALQASGPGVAHGALHADRIVLTSDGHLCIVEQALGSALRRLNLTPAVLWREFGLLAPAGERGLVTIGPRTDVVQLGTIALSLLLARPIGLQDFERRLPALLDEFSALADVSPSVFAEPLRVWLERALQLAPRSYRSADDAREGLDELPVARGPAPALGGVVPISEVAAQAPLRPSVPNLLPPPLPTLHSESRLDSADASDRIEDWPRETGHESVFADGGSDAAQTQPVAAETATAGIEDPVERRVERDTRRWKRAYTAWIATALGAIVLAEGAIIARLGTQPAVVTIAAPAIPVATQPLERTPPIETASFSRPDASDQAAVQRVANADAATALAAAAARQRSGGLRVSSPIQLYVFEGDRVLGSTADGPIVTTAGTHQLDLVNTSLGYRTHQTVTITAGVIAPLTIPAPIGRLNINAQPWAQVLIDDSPVGETPLANVAVALGQHRITFRHPQLGERYETVTVRADTIARVSVAFQ